MTTVRGFMTLHMYEGNKLYVELPDSLLGREMLLGTTIEESSDPGEGFAGQQPRDPLHVVFTRSDSLICLRRVHADVLVEGDSLMARAVRRSNINPVIASFPVKCKAPDGSSVFEATSFFVNGAPAMRPHDPYGINSFGGFLSTTVNYVAGCSLLSGVEAFADNVSVLSSLSFTLTTRFGGYLINKDMPYTALARRSLMLLPREVMMPRLCDSRIGTVPVAFVKFSDREQEARRSIMPAAGTSNPPTLRRSRQGSSRRPNVRSCSMSMTRFRQGGMMRSGGACSAGTRLSRRSVTAMRCRCGPIRATMRRSIPTTSSFRASSTPTRWGRVFRVPRASIPAAGRFSARRSAFRTT